MHVNLKICMVRYQTKQIQLVSQAQTNQKLILINNIQIYTLLQGQSTRMFTKGLLNRIHYFSKIFNCPKEAIKGIKDNSLVLVGGFGICGVPMNLINAVRESGVKNLTCVSNNCGFQSKDKSQIWGLAILLKSKQIKRMISSYVGQNPQFQSQYNNGQLQLQICPQGTLAQKIRSGGAGIPAFYTATGVGTQVQQGGFPIKYKKGTNQVQILSKPKPTGTFKGKKYVLEESIVGDFALVKAYKADKAGNLIFNKTARNFNADMCTAAKCVIAEVQQIVQAGQIDPDHVHVPGVFVDRIYLQDPKSQFSKKKIQKLTVTKKKSGQESSQKPSQKKESKNPQKKDTRIKIIKRAAQQVKSGIGIPTLLPNVLPKQVKINLQSQNGIFGVGPYPYQGQQDPDLIDAGKATITVSPGGSFFPSSTSFGIIRGGHLDLTILGAMEVSQKGDIANWIIPKKLVKGMGGAMDLVSCGSKVIVVMEHTAKDSLKILSTCNLPLTAKQVVNMVITQLAVFENQNGKLVLTQIAQDTTLEQVQKKTGFKITTAPELKKF